MSGERKKGKSARLGQHFMIDEDFLSKVADAAQLEESESILEIGPGEGALTKFLAKKCSVTAIEKDQSLIRILSKNVPKANVVNADALKIVWPRFDKCVSNLPYSISKPFILKLLCQDFTLAVLVLQDEFAKKLVAKPGEDNYGVVSVCAQLCCEVELLEKIPKNAFLPQPKVESRIVRLRPRLRLDDGFLAFITKVFQNRNRLLCKKRVREYLPQEFLILYADNTAR